ncbi:hypothetical protein BH11PLA2_BH11PLA2_14490 [soil metagenome]
MKQGILLLILLAIGCKAINERELERGRASLPPTDLVDPAAVADHPFVNAPDIYSFAEKVRKDKQKTKPDKIYNLLAISGGGSYGAYCAGVLCGWTDAGTRPVFDVVTGVSTGGLVATLAFLGPEYDVHLKRVYTTLRNEDIFKMLRPVRAALFGSSLADNAPLAVQIDQTMTEQAFQGVAAAHAQGRRLYVGTTNIQSKLVVTWDMGAIASRNDAASRKLFKQILLASAAIPGFFPPQKIDITVDGVPYQELHVDGGATSAFLVRSPPEDTAAKGQATMTGSNLYVLVAGKLYADQDAVRSRTYTIAANAISSILYSLTRSQLNEAYNATMLLGMNYYMSAIPPDFKAPLSSTDFNPEEMGRMFDEGYRLTIEKRVWQSKPVYLEEQPQMRKRTGTALTQGPKKQATATEGVPVPGPDATGPTPPTAK